MWPPPLFGCFGGETQLWVQLAPGAPSGGKTFLKIGTHNLFLLFSLLLYFFFLKELFLKCFRIHIKFASGKRNHSPRILGIRD